MVGQPTAGRVSQQTRSVRDLQSNPLVGPRWCSIPISIASNVSPHRLTVSGDHSTIIEANGAIPRAPSVVWFGLRLDTVTERAYGRDRVGQPEAAGTSLAITSLLMMFWAG